ncbi:5537_t:CDS:2 [Funneliformis geosporum]|nr:5537_t:CDS:2 [Funneliformis geosporum]
MGSKKRTDKNFIQESFSHWSFFCLLQYSLFIICPILENTKIATYRKYHIPLNMTIEYFVFGTLWIVIPTRTINELGTIPFFCPMDYDYKFPQLRSVCQIRTTNLVFMWITSISILLAWIWTVLPELLTPKEDDDENYGEKGKA